MYEVGLCTCVCGGIPAYMVDKQWDVEGEGEPVATKQQDQRDEEVKAILWQHQLRKSTINVLHQNWLNCSLTRLRF